MTFPRLMRPYTPIHQEIDFTPKWWEDRGFTFGDKVYFNVIRDGSGNYNGYLANLSNDPSNWVILDTSAKAQQYIDSMRST